MAKGGAVERFGNTLLIAGTIAVAVGLIGLLSQVLQRIGVAFVFPVTPWYGPFLGGIFAAAIGWYLRRRSGSLSRVDA